MNEKYRVCLLGVSTETGNRGVSALAASTIKIINKIKPNSKYYFLGGNKASVERTIYDDEMQINTKLINYRLSPRSKWNEHILMILIAAIIHHFVPITVIRKNIIKIIPCLELLNGSNFIGSLHGGDSFSDIYGMKRFIYSIIPDLLTILMNKELILLPQTYGPYKGSIAKKIALFILKRSKFVISRDENSIEYIRILYKNRIKEKKIRKCPDVAFFLGVKEVPEIEKVIGRDGHERLIGININGLMYKGGFSQKNMFGLKCDYKKIVDLLIENICNIEGNKILLIPHTYGPKGSIDMDPEVSEEVYRKYNDKYLNRIKIIKKEYDQSELKYIIGKCNFFIGSRMHACIAAISQGIPTIAIAYSRKFEGVFGMVNMHDSVIDAKKETEDQSVEKIINAIGKDRNQDIIKKNIEIGKSQIIRVFNEIIENNVSG